MNHQGLMLVRDWKVWNQLVIRLAEWDHASERAELVVRKPAHRSSRTTYLR
jgi:hypothetical protein